MGCRPSYQGTRLIMDCPTCGLGLATPQCINSHLKVTSALPKLWKTMRYEEEVLVELDEEKTAIIYEYDALIRQVEGIMLNQKTYGRPEDEHYLQRKKLLKDFYDYMFMNPLVAEQVLRGARADRATDPGWAPGALRSPSARLLPVAVAARSELASARGALRSSGAPPAAGRARAPRGADAHGPPAGPGGYG
jgi:hypothetical protein